MALKGRLEPTDCRPANDGNRRFLVFERFPARDACPPSADLACETQADRVKTLFCRGDEVLSEFSELGNSV
jgi:hypothetical protein